jgi:hypothetical protein
VQNAFTQQVGLGSTEHLGDAENSVTSPGLQVSVDEAAEAAASWLPDVAVGG